MIARSIFSITLLLSGCVIGEDITFINENNNPWFQSGIDAVKQRSAINFRSQQAKNVILFVGDGMGISTVTASRIYDGQSRGEQGEKNALAFEKFPHVALIKTYNANQQVPDSAGTSSAMQTGVKTRAGVIGVSHYAHRSNCEEALKYTVPTLAEYAESLGMATGVVTTMKVTDGTPAAVYAHTPERDWERDSLLPDVARKAGCRDIASQLIDFSKGDGLDVVFGGGRENFFGSLLSGKRASPKDNLIQKWRNKGDNRKYITTSDELNVLDLNTAGQVVGLFGSGHLEFMMNRPEKLMSQLCPK